MFPATLDASLFTTGSKAERSQFGEDLINCFKKDGFVKLRNHGIPIEVLKGILAWEKRFFDLPLDTKKICAHAGGMAPVRGYNGYSQEKSWKLSPGNEGLLDAKDARESFDIGPIHDTRYLNNWLPEAALPTFRDHMEYYYTTFQDTANYLLQAIELGLALPAGSLISRAIPDASELRLNHYPSVSKRVLTTTNTRRIWPHTDLGILSLLLQDSEGGLEFEDRNNPGSFLPVHNEAPWDVIVNVSDMLERWTNGFLRAGLHRVVEPQQQQAQKTDRLTECMLPERFSVVFLYRPGEAKPAGPMNQFVSEERPASFDDISALGYLERQNKLVYG